MNSKKRGHPLSLPSKTKIPPVSGTAILPVEIRAILSKKSQIDTFIIYQTLYLSVAHFKREEKEK